MTVSTKQLNDMLVEIDPANMIHDTDAQSDEYDVEAEHILNAIHEKGLVAEDAIVEAFDVYLTGVYCFTDDEMDRLVNLLQS